MNFDKPKLEKEKVPHIVSADPESIRVYFPKSDTYVTVSILFDTLEDHDDFFLSTRSLKAFEKYKGRILLAGEHIPHKLINKIPDTTNSGKTLPLKDPSEIGITAEEDQELASLFFSYFFPEEYA